MSDPHWYTSEGSWGLGIDPFVASSALQPMFAMQAGQEAELPKNLVFERLNFSTDCQSLRLGMESARYQDGSTPTDSFQHVRHHRDPGDR